MEQFLKTIRYMEIDHLGNTSKMYGICKAKDLQNKVEVILNDADVMGYLEVEKVI